MKKTLQIGLASALALAVAAPSAMAGSYDPGSTTLTTWGPSAPQIASYTGAKVDGVPGDTWIGEPQQAYMPPAVTHDGVVEQPESIAKVDPTPVYPGHPEPARTFVTSSADINDDGLKSFELSMAQDWQQDYGSGATLMGAAATY